MVLENTPTSGVHEPKVALAASLGIKSLISAQLVLSIGDEDYLNCAIKEKYYEH